MSASATADDGWFAIVDAAQDPSLEPLVRQCAERQCLIAGKLEPELAATMPYLVRWRAGEPLAEAWRARGTGRHWGILFRSALPIDSLRLHFKKFLQAKLPDGMVVLFRFYDPRVFNTYIRAATPEEREPWFRGIELFAVEGEAPGRLHYYRLHQGRLHDGEAAIG